MSQRLLFDRFVFASNSNPVHHTEANNLWALLGVWRGLVTHGEVVADDEVSGFIFMMILNSPVILGELMMNTGKNFTSFTLCKFLFCRLLIV